ncbi:PREDICTED: dolichyl-diphosphooligosaccharide--protein glycosyltransferase subunit 2-like [Nicrophorus vespilloides]|nr:PREDICTED: dolichyl-diphosphooligosaccharide--protein glycosyltransferase subunit 2-like [Nicrophorus vespilloides]
MFRVAEKRPPQAVSMFFTVAAASPLLLLLIIWMKIGLPFNYFNIYSVPFHLGYAGILALYTWFWLCGNMFSTCVWLVYIGGFTFIAGNRMLRNIATDKK